MKEKVEEEIKRWQPYFYNYETFCINILADVLAFIPEDKREELIKRVEDLLKDVKEPISSEAMLSSIKDDVSNFENMSNEAGMALRTLQWVKDEMEKETK